MTYLEIFQKSLILAGITQSPPTTTVGQTGVYLLQLHQINQAYNEILTSRENWRFLWTSFTPFNTVSGTADHDLSAQNFDRLIEESCTVYLTVSTDVTPLYFMSYHDWVKNYRASTVDDDRPQFITVLPNNQIRLTPTPDAAYTINGEFYRTNPIMSANTDEPIFPDKFHDIIVYDSIVKNGGYIQDEYKVEFNQANRDKLFQQMLWEELLEDDVPQVVTA